MSSDEFTKLFTYLQNMRQDIDHYFDEVNKKFARLQTATEELHGLLEKINDEQAVMAHQLNHHEAWIEKASPKLKIEYDRTV